MRRLTLSLAFAALAGGVLLSAPRQASPFFAVSEIRPGQVGIGRTVFAGDTIEEFKVNILGVLHNVLGPKRDLILARLEGGPLATTGVIQGMSGSPVFIDGRIVGAVSYSLGSFSKEPIAGITPILEMTDAVGAGGPRAGNAAFAVNWSVPSADVFSALRNITRRAAAPVGAMSDVGIVGPAALAELVPALRPIGAAMVFSGFDPTVDTQLRQALGTTAPARPTAGARAADSTTALRPGDAVGLGLIRGDLEMGATGTVTWVDGNRVYAFGHPFLNLGPSSFTMTRSHVFAVLPSLDSSLKIASLGAVVGTITQDRQTAVGGMLGPAPRELEMTVMLSSDHGPDRPFTFRVLQDPTLTPLFSYVAVLNALAGYERQAGALSVSASGTISFGKDGQITIDDQFTGDLAANEAATALALPMAAAAQNDFRSVTADKADFRLRVAEHADSTTIDRVWLDTTKPHLGATLNLQVLLRNYRGDTETVTVPVTMPAHASGPLTLLVSDATTLNGLETREIRPAKPSTWAGLLSQLNGLRRNNRLYVRLLTASAGTVVGGQTLPGLPSTVRSVIDTDVSAAPTPVSRAVVGAWEQRLDRVVRGSRELTITLTPR